MKYNYSDDEIVLHDKEDFDAMHQAGKKAAIVLDDLVDKIEVGVSTQQINDWCHQHILELDCTPAPLNYKGFPKSVCTSVNHVVCHGIPSDKDVLKDGDIVNVDVTVIYKGWYGDTSRMFLVGKSNVKLERLVKVTYDAMMLGIEQIKPGARIGDIGYAIQNYAEKYGYSVVRDYCGHGLGQIFHTVPNILHYGSKNTGDVIKEGMFFTVEPMINLGKANTVLHIDDVTTETGKILRSGYGKRDGWTVTTKDKSLSAQFEHSIGVNENGYEIFTLSPKGLDFPPGCNQNK